MHMIGQLHNISMSALGYFRNCVNVGIFIFIVLKNITFVQACCRFAPLKTFEGLPSIDNKATSRNIHQPCGPVTPEFPL